MGVHLNSTTRQQRPLSPFLSYRWQYTMALSILHRITGCALSVGLLMFVYWLVGIASGADAYVEAARVLQHPLSRVALIVFSVAFFYHLLNGVRHLTWDAGHGFEKRVARRSGWTVFLLSLIATAGFWFAIGSGGAA
jgi:succinate dehydrogenase / fumarate reductase cytochrome b subunit